MVFKKYSCIDFPAGGVDPPPPPFPEGGGGTREYKVLWGLAAQIVYFSKIILNYRHGRVLCFVKLCMG